MRTSGSVEPAPLESEDTAPVLLLGLGNPLMSDDGAGQEILAQLESEAPNWGGRVEFLDGGTQGLALLGRFDGRKAVLFLDAVRLGDKPGAVHMLRGEELARMGSPGVTAHEGSAPQISSGPGIAWRSPAGSSGCGYRAGTARHRNRSVGGRTSRVPAAASVARRTITKILTAI